TWGAANLVTLLTAFVELCKYEIRRVKQRPVVVFQLDENAVAPRNDTRVQEATHCLMIQGSAIVDQAIRVSHAHAIGIHEYPHQEREHLLYNALHDGIAVPLRDKSNVYVGVGAELSAAISARGDH